MKETAMFEIYREMTTQDAKYQRCFFRRVAAIGLGAAVAIVLLVAVSWPTKAHAVPMYEANNEGIKVTLYNDPCELKNHITNLPYKATWEEKGKTFNGCWGARPDYGLVQFWFEDKTVGLIPVDALVRIHGA